MIITTIERHLFIPGLVTLILCQGHGGIRKGKSASFIFFLFFCFCLNVCIVVTVTRSSQYAFHDSGSYLRENEHISEQCKIFNAGLF